MIKKADSKEIFAILAEIRAQLADLDGRVAKLEGGAPDGHAAAPQQAAEAPAPQAPAAPAISEEVLLAISAAVAAFMGERVHIRQIRVISSPAWAQQGRVNVQASHRLH